MEESRLLLERIKIQKKGEILHYIIKKQERKKEKRKKERRKKERIS